MKMLVVKNSVKSVCLVVILCVSFATNVFGQMPPVKVPSKQNASKPAQNKPKPKPQSQPKAPVVQEDSTMYYLILMVLVLGLGAAVFWWYKTKKASATEGTDKNKKNEANEVDEWGAEALDADAELEWFRSTTKKKKPVSLPKTSKILKKKKKKDLVLDSARVKKVQKDFEKKKFEGLPINTFAELREVSPFEDLPISDDKSLLTAIDQSYEEDDDEEVRELALRVLAKFKTQNAVEALSQIAHYDLSASLRSKAVSVLADFDHESVFESILLACADPTREVRAAAARSLFRLSFDRADAYARIAKSEDDFRIVQAARAAIESDLVDRSIDRLVHEDSKYAYEAFVLIALLVEAGETKEIFEVIENRRDNSVKLAILHALKVLKDKKTLPELYNYIERNSLPEDLGTAANDVIRSFEPAVA